jgi:hypothetical protein
MLAAVSAAVRPWFVVADVGQEIDATAKSAQPDGDIERAATDMLDRAFERLAVLDDVDECFTDHQPAGHGFTPWPARRRTLTL